jgi:CRISPR-associated protein Cmr2
MNQSLKIAAFLNKLPYYALFPDKAQERRQEVIQSLVGSDIDLTQIEHISQLAESLDIPPFVRDLDQNCFKKNPCVTHLLSAQTCSLKIGDIDADAVHDHLLKTIDIIKQFPERKDNLYLALWRYLPEMLAENDPSTIGKYWHVLPADPCMPSHSIWEHSSIASAIAGAYPNPNLLIFTIASAQEMVTTARRTQDAWMGSFLLSYLSWQAVKVIAENCGPDALIFPSLRSQPIVDLWLHKEKGFTQLSIDAPSFKSALEVGNIPNIFTAIIPGDCNEAKSLAQKAQLAVKNKWMEISECVRSQCESTVKFSEDWGVDISSWKEIWDRQRNGFLDDMGIFWSICPWGDDVHAVISAAQKIAMPVQPGQTNPIDQLNAFLQNLQEKNYPTHIGMVYHPLSGFAAKGLTARKNLRDFHNNPEPGHRCTLCGKWQAVHPQFSDLTGVKCVTDLIKDNRLIDDPDNETYAYRWLLSFWRAFGNISRQDHLKLKGRVRKGERLCSLCLTRRLAMEAYFEKNMKALDRHQFPSTAGICTAVYRGNILHAMNKAPEKWESILDGFVSTVTRFIKTNNLPYPAASVEFYHEHTAKNKLAQKFLKIDGDWLFDITYDLQSLKNMYDLEDIESIDNCKSALKSLNKLAKDHDIKKPSPYYAIIAMDGDKMGEWLTGRRAPDYQWLFHPDVRNDSLVEDMVPVDYQRPLGPALQLGMSDSLKNYALYQVRKIVEKDHPGKLIYAGGR